MLQIIGKAGLKLKNRTIGNTMRIKLKHNVKSEYLKSEIAYTVYAIYLTVPLKFMILVEDLPSAPYAISAKDVEITDGRLSKYWVIGNVESDNNQPPIISFHEWANDFLFFEDIVNGGKAGSIWRSYQNKFEHEFAEESISKTAITLAGNWVQCAECDDAWEEKNDCEIISCPNCGTKQIKPNVIVS
jgi:4-hydroxy-3-methylbut-2-en-1-yl diphosphate synthase IspG/GcpE